MHRCRMLAGSRQSLNSYGGSIPSALTCSYMVIGVATRLNMYAHISDRATKMVCLPFHVCLRPIDDNIVLDTLSREAPITPHRRCI
jgi:hypothetical protein